MGISKDLPKKPEEGKKKLPLLKIFGAVLVLLIVGVA